jgi:branched-chain amino acid transport system permease protein
MLNAPTQVDVVQLLVGVLLAYSMALPLRLGLFSIAPAAFAGVGAYGFASLSAHAHWPIVASIVAACLVSLVGGVILAVPLARIGGIYTGIATLSIVVIATGVESSASFTGGVFGFSGVPVGVVLAPMVVAVALVALLFMWFDRSALGRRLDVAGWDPKVAASLGVPVARARALALAGSALVAGFAGCEYAHSIGFISPDSFNFVFSIQIAAYAIVGGARHWAGPLIAATIVGLPSTAIVSLGLWGDYIAPGLMVIVLIGYPGGIAAVLRRRLRKKVPVGGVT